MKSFIIFSIAAASLMLSPAQAANDDKAEAQTQQKASHAKPGGKPPQTAIDACLEQAAQAKCSFQGPNELEFGVCEETPDGQYFACKPNHK